MMTWQEIAVKAEELRIAIQSKAYDDDVRGNMELLFDAITRKLDSLPYNKSYAPEYQSMPKAEILEADKNTQTK